MNCKECGRALPQTREKKITTSQIQAEEDCKRFLKTIDLFGGQANTTEIQQANFPYLTSGQVSVIGSRLLKKGLVEKQAVLMQRQLFGKPAYINVWSRKEGN